MGSRVLLRVPRPLRGLLLDLRKTHNPTQPASTIGITGFEC